MKGYMMGHNHMWTMEDERALEIIHELLANVLQTQPKKYLPIQELISSLNKIGKKYKIHHQKKHNCWSKYIKMKYGSFEVFLSNFGMYDVILNKATQKTYVYYLEDHLEPFEFVPRFTKDKEWVFIE
jgi:hypothetical protein